MNTPAHIALNLVILGGPERPEDTFPIAVGSLLPDLPMVIFYGYEKLLRRLPESLIWSQAYHDPAWQALFDGLHSLPLLLVAVAVCWSIQARRSLLLFAAMILHGIEDMPFHHSDAHRHLFPLSSWRFQSPLSYWDPHHYGHFIAPLEGLLFALCAAILAKRATSPGARMLLALLVAAYGLYWVYVIWVWA